MMTKNTMAQINYYVIVMIPLLHNGYLMKNVL